VTLLDTEKRQLASLVSACCKMSLRRREFNLACRAGWLSADDTARVYRKTLRSVENKPHLACLIRYATKVATKEAIRYFRAHLAKERSLQRLGDDGKKRRPLDDSILGTEGASRDPIHVDPALIVEQRDLAEKLVRLIDQLPADVATVIRAKMHGSHGDGAVLLAGKNLGISRNAAYALLQSGMQRLRQQFPEMEV
jgi:DNA-directed RNA polymerase specialized sigma24 family protein